jgi:hypothetical protein
VDREEAVLRTIKQTAVGVDLDPCFFLGRGFEVDMVGFEVPVVGCGVAAQQQTTNTRNKHVLGGDQRTHGGEGPRTIAQQRVVHGGSKQATEWGTKTPW